MKLGISTASYYPMKTEDALAAVVNGGAACTELFFNSFSELSPEYLRQLKSILVGGQTTLVSVHPFTCGIETMLFFGDYPRRFDDGLEFYKQYFSAAAELGASYCVLHGAINNHGISTEHYIDSYGKLHLAAQAFGIKMAQENVGRCMSRDPQLFMALRTAIPDAAFVLDIKQTFRCNSSVNAFLDAMGKNIAHIHLSDANDSVDCMPIGDGNFDFRSFLIRLAKDGYGGDAVLELYKESYSNEEQLWTSIKHLQKIMDDAKIFL